MLRYVGTNILQSLLQIVQDIEIASLYIIRSYCCILSITPPYFFMQISTILCGELWKYSEILQRRNNIQISKYYDTISLAKHSSVTCLLSRYKIFTALVVIKISIIGIRTCCLRTKTLLKNY